jgi:hypothetical protein
MHSTQPGDGAEDGTRQLLQTGVGTLVAGVLAALLANTVFGGIGRQGPHTSSGWIALIVAMMCLPFGSLAFVLGAAKWLRNRRLSASRRRVPDLPLNAVSRDPKSLLSFSEHSMEQRSHGKERQ